MLWQDKVPPLRLVVLDPRKRGMSHGICTKGGADDQVTWGDSTFSKSLPIPSTQGGLGLGAVI